MTDKLVCEKCKDLPEDLLYTTTVYDQFTDTVTDNVGPMMCEHILFKGTCN